MKNNKQAVKKCRERKKAQGLKRVDIWACNLPKCIKEIKKAVIAINNKYIERLNKQVR